MATSESVQSRSQEEMAGGGARWQGSPHGNLADQSQLPISSNATEYRQRPLDVSAAIPLEDRLERIEALLAALVRQQTVRDWYSTDQVAKLLNKSEFTVREWARLKRINAEKRKSGRGAHAGWVISHAELLRLQREGLLPLNSGA